MLFCMCILNVCLMMVCHMYCICMGLFVSVFGFLVYLHKIHLVFFKIKFKNLIEILLIFLLLKYCVNFRYTAK